MLQSRRHLQQRSHSARKAHLPALPVWVGRPMVPLQPEDGSLGQRMQPKHLPVFVLQEWHEHLLRLEAATMEGGQEPKRRPGPEASLSIQAENQLRRSRLLRACKILTLSLFTSQSDDALTLRRSPQLGRQGVQLSSQRLDFLLELWLGAVQDQFPERFDIAGRSNDQGACRGVRVGPHR